jgi:hypothetical protein
VRGGLSTPLKAPELFFLNARLAAFGGVLRDVVDGAVYEYERTLAAEDSVGAPTQTHNGILTS